MSETGFGIGRQRVSSRGGFIFSLLVRVEQVRECTCLPALPSHEVHVSSLSSSMLQCLSQHGSVLCSHQVICTVFVDTYLHTVAISDQSEVRIHSCASSSANSMFANNRTSNVELAAAEQRRFISGQSVQVVEQFHHDREVQNTRKQRKEEEFKRAHFEHFGTYGVDDTDYTIKLQKWVLHFAMPVCSVCGSHQQTALRSNSCLNPKVPPLCETCQKGLHWIPHPNDIPEVLHGFSLDMRFALRPVELHQGDIERGTNLGYRHTTRPSRLSWSAVPVETKINRLTGVQHHKAQKAFQYLMSQPLSAYSYWVNKHRRWLRHQRGDKNWGYSGLTAVSIECALWPDLYCWTVWCERQYTTEESSYVS